MTHEYQSSPEFQGLTVANMIPSDAYEALLSQPKCKSVRTYFAIKEAALTIVVVGVNANGDDITDGIILDQAKGCPAHCDNDSDLML